MQRLDSFLERDNQSMVEFQHQIQAAWLQQAQRERDETEHFNVSFVSALLEGSGKVLCQVWKLRWVGCD